MARKPAPREQQLLTDRLRELLAGERVTREVSMFGGRCFMVSGKILASAGKNGDLLVRVAAESHDEMLSRPGAEQAEMGSGRTMGDGWIHVGAPAIAGDEQLRSWIDPALAHNRASSGRTV